MLFRWLRQFTACVIVPVAQRPRGVLPEWGCAGFPLNVPVDQLYLLLSDPFLFG